MPGRGKQDSVPVGRGGSLWVWTAGGSRQAAPGKVVGQGVEPPPLQSLGGCRKESGAHEPISMGPKP